MEHFLGMLDGGAVFLAFVKLHADRVPSVVRKGGMVREAQHRQPGVLCGAAIVLDIACGVFTPAGMGMVVGLHVVLSGAVVAILAIGERS